MRIPPLRQLTPRRAARSGLLALAAFGLVAGGALAGEQATGLTDEAEYRSPTYGYEVTWDRPWEPNPEGTVSDDAVDMLTLETYGGFLQIIGVASDWTPEEFAADYVENFDGSLYKEVEVVEQGEADGVAYLLIEGEMDDGTLVEYVEIRQIAEATIAAPPLVTLTRLVSVDDTFANNAAAAVADIELEGEPALVALDADDRADDAPAAERGRDGGKRDEDDDAR